MSAEATLEAIKQTLLSSHEQHRHKNLFDELNAGEAYKAAYSDGYADALRTLGSIYFNLNLPRHEVDAFGYTGTCYTCGKTYKLCEGE